MLTEAKHEFLDKYVGECPGYSYLLDALLDIYIMTRAPEIERHIIDLFGADLLRRMIEDWVVLE